MSNNDDQDLNDADWKRALDQAATLYDKGGDSRVPGMFHALRVTITLLDENGASTRQLKPLRALLFDLDRANHGQRLRVIRLRKGFSSIAPDRQAGSFVAQQACALVIEEILFRSHGATYRSRGRACKEAVKLMRKHHFTTQVGHPISENVLRQWSADARSSKHEFEETRRFYRQGLEAYPTNLSASEGRQAAEKLASSVAQADPSRIVEN